MNKFKESLKVDLLSDNVPNTSYVDKIALNIYEAVLNTTPENEEEKLKQIDILHNVNKFIYDYENDEEFRRILANYNYAKKYRIIQPKKESEER